MRPKSVCFVATTARVERPVLDGSTRYRCYHVAEGLISKGIITTVVSHQRFLEAPVFDFDVYVFHRPTTVDRGFLPMLHALSRAGKILVADYDDLIFGNSELALQSSICRNGIRTPDHTIALFNYNLRALRFFSTVTVSTHTLAHKVREFHSNASVHVTPNTLSANLIQLHEETLGAREKPPADVIAYFAGTKSHDHDFKVVADIVLQVLNERDTAYFIVVGPVEIGGPLSSHPRVIRYDVTNYWRMFGLMRQCHTSIAPLERSEFNECKSNVKFLESSLARCRLVATPIPDVQRCLPSCVYFAESAQDWYRFLSEDKRDFPLSFEAEENFQRVSATHTSIAAADRFLAILEEARIKEPA